MNRVELEAFVAERTGIKKNDVAKVLDATLDIVTKALSDGDTVRLVGFMTLNVKDRAARVGKNPKTGETIPIAASRKVAFRAGKDLTKAVNRR